MRTWLKEESSMVQDGSMGDGDKWRDLRDRIHGLGDLDQGDEQEAVPGFMGPKLIKLGNSSRNDLLYKRRSKMAGKVPDIVYKLMESG